MSTTDVAPRHGTRTGHCLCGSISCRFDARPEAVVVCHRGDCGVYINSCFADSPRLPFGGENSGFGRELSEVGIGEFLNRKMVKVAR